MIFSERNPDSSCLKLGMCIHFVCFYFVNSSLVDIIREPRGPDGSKGFKK